MSRRILIILSRRRTRRGGASISFGVSIGSGIIISGNQLTATVTGLQGGESVDYQWTTNGSNISGANSVNYTPVIGVGGVTDLSDIRCRVVVDGGNPIESGTREIRYASGSFTPVSDQNWVVDTPITPIDISASGTGLVFDYAVSNLPNGVSLVGTNITGTPTELESGSSNINRSDQYNRQYNDSFNWSMSLPAIGSFSSQPQITGTPHVGQTLTLTNGTFSTSATFSIVEFSLDGVDKTSELSGSDWDTTGENIYGANGTIQYRVRATDDYGRTVDSNLITTTLLDVPDQVVITATDNANGNVTLNGVNPDDGNSPITTLQWRRDGGSWTNFVDFPEIVDGGSTGTRTFEVRAVNAVGNGAAGSDSVLVTNPSVGTLTIDEALYIRGNAGVNPDLTVELSEDGTTGPYTLFWATRSVATPLSKSNIENGTGNSLDNGSITNADINNLDAILDLSISLSSGFIDLFARGTNVETDVVTTVSGVNYNASPPQFVSASVENSNPNRVVVLLNQDSYNGGFLPADFSFAGFTVTSSSLFNTTTLYLGLSGNVSNGANLSGSLSYSGNGIVGVDAEVMPTFSNEDVTNNVAAGPAFAGLTYVGGIMLPRVDPPDNYAEAAIDLNIDSGEDIYIHVTSYSFETRDTIAVTIDPGGLDISLTEVANTEELLDDCRVNWWEIKNVGSALGTGVVVRTQMSGLFTIDARQPIIHIYKSRASEIKAVNTDTQTDNTPLDVSMNTSAGDAVAAVFSPGRNEFTGFTLNAPFVLDSIVEQTSANADMEVTAASVASTSAGTPLSLTATPTEPADPSLASAIVIGPV